MADRDFEQENLFKEIDEDLRQERYARLWKKYGNYLIAAAVVLVASIAGYQGWQAWDRNQRADLSTRFEAAREAVRENRIEDALNGLRLIAEESSGGYALLARFNEAALLAGRNDVTAAVQAYLAIANDSGVDKIYRDLALLLATLNDLDSGDPQELMQRVAPLTAADNPWRHTAKEVTAILARKVGDHERASKLFQELADDATAPAGVRARAAEMSQIIGG